MTDKDDYDIVVIGGGVAGVFAAIGASSGGRKVLLVEQNASLGGQGTLTGERQFCGDVTHVNQPFQEVLDELNRYKALNPIVPTRGGTPFDGELLAFILLEKVLKSGVDVLFHTTLVDADCQSGKIDSIQIFNKSGLQTIRAKYYVDCTGDADLAQMAGFPTVKGGDVFLPDGGIRPGIQLQLPMSLCFYMEDTGSRVEPILPEGCPTWRDDDDIPMTTVVPKSPHTVFVKMKVIGGDITVGSSYSQAEVDSRRQMMGLVYHLQTKGYQGKVYDTYKLRYVCPGLGIREGRRIVGEYYLTEDDLRRGRHFQDAVAVGTYQIDYHWPDVLQRAGTGITDQVPPYHIPYGALIPKNGKNIAVAGRCVSGEQMAMASFRVMATCAHTGLAAGMGCSLAIEDGLDLQDLDVSKLQAKLVGKGLDLNTTPYRRFRRQRRMVKETVLEEERSQPLLSSTLLELDDSETLVVWSEGYKPQIWSARRVEGSWQPPVRVMGEGTTARDPALFPGPEGGIHLVYDDGEDKTHIVSSSDGGLSWGEPRNLMPEGMGRSSCGNKVLVSSEGEWIIPTVVPDGDALGLFVDISHDRGKTWARNRVTALEGKIGRSVLWKSSPGIFHILIDTGSGVLLRSDSGDGGIKWSPVYNTDLQSSGDIDIAVMEDGEIALLHKPAGTGKAQLAVSLSEDNGRTWPHRYVLEDESASVCSPSVIPSPEGISLTYTSGRNIAFRRLSVEHLKDLL